MPYLIQRQWEAAAAPLMIRASVTHSAHCSACVLVSVCAWVRACVCVCAQFLEVEVLPPLDQDLTARLILLSSE